MPLSEDEFMEQVAELAHLRGWLLAHFRSARTSAGWRTPCQYDAKGWPDLVLVRDRVLFRELKAEGGLFSRDQQRWLSALVRAGADARVWRPSDWNEIEETLA